MKRFFLSAAVLAVALSSCSKNEIADNTNVPSNAIGFGTYVGSATRASVENGFDAADIFNVDAYYTAQKTIDAAGATLAPFMQDQKVIAAAGAAGAITWSYSPIKYWPNNDGDKVSFFAATDATGTQYKFNELTNAQPSFTVASAASDIMVASALNQLKTTPKVSFMFQHTMSQVNFTVKLKEALAETAQTTVEVTKLDVNYNGAALGGGTFTFSNTTANEGEWAVTAGSARANDTWSTDGSFGIGTDLNNTAVTPLGEPIMVIPVTGASYTATVTYTVTTKGLAGDTENDSKITNVCTFDIAPAKMNTIYNYNLVIGLTEVDVEAKLVDWATAAVESIVYVRSSTGTVML